MAYTSSGAAKAILLAVLLALAFAWLINNGGLTWQPPGTVDKSPLTVRVWGDTAVITALLHIKGATREGKAFDYKLWFSDTYARTPAGWKYVFGQASLPLPAEPGR